MSAAESREDYHFQLPTFRHSSCFDDRSWVFGMEGQENIEQLETALESFIDNHRAHHGAVKDFAAASRTSAAVRERLAQPKALKTFTDVIKEDLEKDPGTAQDALRCIGNACADNNAARDAINDLGFGWASECLEKGTDDVKLLATKVLYNICNDYPPSQQQCYRERIPLALMVFLALNIAASHPDENAISAIDLLFWITGHKEELEPNLSEEELKPEIASRIFQLPGLYVDSLDVEDYGCLLESTLVYLRDPVVQKEAYGSVIQIMDLLRATQNKAKSADDAEDRKLLEPLCTSLIWCLSDIAAQPGFAEYARENGVIDAARSDIELHCRNASQSGGEVGLASLTALCEVLGNILWKSRAEECSRLVDGLEEQALDAMVFSCIVDIPGGPSTAPVLHSMAGLLLHLSRPSVSIREQMGARPSARSALERLCRHEMSQIKQDGVKLLRALGKECPTNQERFAEIAKEAMLSLKEANSAASEETQVD